jgi:hypothetical protein
MWERFKDRGYNVHLKKYPEEKEDDEPNTKKVEQKQLEILYAGGTFEHEQNLSRMMSIFLVIMFFSSGMPVMYIFAFCFFFFTYFVNKILLIQYYKKNKDFTYEIPLGCANLFKYAILLKLLVGFFMFFNSRVLRLKNQEQENIKSFKILYICLVILYFGLFFVGDATKKALAKLFGNLKAKLFEAKISNP